MAQNPSELRVLFDPLEDWQRGIKLVERLPQNPTTLQAQQAILKALSPHLSKDPSCKCINEGCDPNAPKDPRELYLFEDIRGSFTRAGVQQQVHPYGICHEHIFTRAGLAVFDAGRLVGIIETFHAGIIYSVRDINLNGLDEVLLVNTDSIVVLELANSVKLLGEFRIGFMFSRADGGMDHDCRQPLIFEHKKIFVRKGLAPKFFSELYQWDWCKQNPIKFTKIQDLTPIAPGLPSNKYTWLNR